MPSHVKLDRLSAALALVLDEDPEFPIRRLQVLLYVAAKGPCTSSDISKSLVLFKANTGKHLQALADSHNGVKGHGFITIDFEGSDYRSKFAKLTPKGEKFLQSILGVL